MPLCVGVLATHRLTVDLLAAALAAAAHQRGLRLLTVAVPVTATPRVALSAVTGVDVAVVLGAAAHDYDLRLLSAAAQRWPTLFVASDEGDVELAVEALTLGTAGWRSAADSPAEVIGAAATIAGGEAAWPSSTLLATLRRLPPAPLPRDGRVPAGITGREHDVLRALAHGLSSVEIAEALGISLATVRTHLRAVRRKLGVSSTAAAVAMAHQSGWVGRTFLPYPRQSGSEVSA